jgi:predicted nucleotidyltransferase
VDKTARARMALAAGADLALEFPCAFSCRNAGIFADAAIDIIAASGIVSYVSFGTEADENKKGLFEAIADILNEEPAAFAASLKKYLREGNSYVSSRSMALEEMLPGSLELLKSPNNNLALAYTKRIREKKYPLETFHTQRIGAGFHERGAEPGDTASASAIREMIRRDEGEACRRFLPGASADILEEEIKNGRAAVKKDRFWRAVRMAVLRAAPEEMANVAEMSEGFENRMREFVYAADSMDDFVERCRARRYPRGRIQRYCAHILLNLRRETSLRLQRNGPAYIKTLGANETGRKVLRLMKGNSRLPILSRAGGRVSGYAGEILSFERAATQIWETLTDEPKNDAERRAVPALTRR